jgi:hypothetical protein
MILPPAYRSVVAFTAPFSRTFEGVGGVKERTGWN